MSARLVLVVCATAAALLAAHAAQFPVCTEETQGLLIGRVEELHYKLAPYQMSLDVVLPLQRPGIIHRGLHVIACGMSAPTINLNLDKLLVIRGEGQLWTEVNVTVKRYFTMFPAPTTVASVTYAEE